MKFDSEYCNAIIEFYGDIQEYLSSYSRISEALKHKIVYDAVLRKLQLIAETTQRFSKSFKEQYPNIAWQEMSGFRNIVVHDYLGEIDPTIITEVIEHHVPLLIQQLTNQKN